NDVSGDDSAHGAHTRHGQADRSGESAGPKFADDGGTNSGKVAHDPPGLTALANDSSGDDPAQPRTTNQCHHANADPAINDVAKNHRLQLPTDTSLLTAAQLDDNGAPAVTDGAHPGGGQVDGSELASPKFADDGSTNSGNVAQDPPALTALPSDVSGDDSAQPRKTNHDHHSSPDPQINDVANNH